ncbi:sensor histidine kinase EsaS [soil metagenome]
MNLPVRDRPPLTRDRARTQRLNRSLRYLAVAFMALAAVLFFVFVTASANSAFGERNYTLLLWLNVALLACLALTVMVLAWRLWQRRRDGKFGARLMIRFAVTFTLVGVLPGTLIWLVSGQYLARSLDSWFNVRIETALDAGLTLGRTALDEQKLDVAGRARSMAGELAGATPGTRGPLLNRLREQAQVAEVLMFTASGRVLASAGSAVQLAPDLPSSAAMGALRVSRSYVAVEGDPIEPAPSRVARSDGSDRAGLRVRAVVPVAQSTESSLSSEQVYLQLIQPVPPSLAQNAQNVEAVSQDYRQLALARQGLQRIYGVTLTMALLLSMFGAMVVALLLAGRFARPLLALAEGTRAVAGGDYRALPEPKLRDEIGALTESFNAMTAQLADARETVQANETQLQRSNAFLSGVLANISTGVLVLDGRFQLLSANDAAAHILGEPIDTARGQALENVPVIGRLALALSARFASEVAAGRATWQQKFEIERADAGPLVLLMRGSRLVPRAAGNGDPGFNATNGPQASGANISGYVIAFDDISDVISAQRAIAWAEVARRLAHEIKNPLTPIQLSAERLEHKLASKLSPEDAAMLRKGASTIVAQVSAMKHMVDEFREYARMPAAALVPLDLNALIDEVLALYGGSEARVQAELGEGLPTIPGDATQLRQIIHNLLQNAQDAVAAAKAAAAPGLPSVTDSRPDVIVRTTRLEYGVKLEVQDRGTGFNPKIIARAFEPYVTTKPRGTGLGLAIVRKIAEEHGARVDIHNVEGGGAVVAVTFQFASPSVSADHAAMLAKTQALASTESITHADPRARA